MLRSIIFWTHLACGLFAGVVIFTMSLTGVLLTYERQIDGWIARSHYVPVAEQGERLSLDALVARHAELQPDTAMNALVVTNDPGAPVSFRAGRRSGLHLNPYNGEPMEIASPRVDAVMSWLTGFHRWFNVQGENRAVARQVTGVCNVVFLFLVLSGMYLWLPKLWKPVMFRARLLFRREYPSSKARDFHWHHIFGIWMALPLLAVVYTGAVISYPWAANVMYRVFGAEVPAPAAAPGGAGGGAVRAEAPVALPEGVALPLESLVAQAIAREGQDWKRLTLTLPAVGQRDLGVEFDRGNGAQAHLRHTLVLDRSSGAVLTTRGFADQSEAQRLRGIARFLHTGEVLGFWGQTLAGLASLAALFLVWTGFALSWRRLIQPLLRKRREAAAVDSGSATA